MCFALCQKVLVFIVSLSSFKNGMNVSENGFYHNIFSVHSEKFCDGRPHRHIISEHAKGNKFISPS
jgi:hypothetical protein